MDNIYALIDAQGIVANVIVWDGVAAFDPAPFTLVPIEDVPAQIGQPCPIETEN